MIDDSSLKKLIGETENLRCRAMVDVEPRVLRDLLHDDLVWIHASGRVDDKAVLIATLERDQPYRHLTISDLVVRRFRDACISSGKIEVALAAPQAPPPYLNLFTNIWAFDGARWVLVQGQSTRCAAQ